MNPFGLEGRTALVTGARRGIGLAIAEALAAAGADIIGVSAQLDPAASEVADRVEAHGRRFTGHAVDFADRAEVVELAETLRTESQSAPIDILINNAGTIRRHPAEHHSLDAWDEVLTVNLSSQFAFTQILAAPMLHRGHGRIIFTASLLSFQGGINVAGYTASKSGVAGLTRALANEWTARGVTVNAIAPGYIATDNTQPLRDDPQRASGILERVPAGRWGEAADVAGAAVFLASDAAAYISGTILPVDGGWLGR